MFKQLLENAQLFNLEKPVHKLFHYEKEEKEFYFFDRIDHYYKLDGSKIKLEPNGEDLLFCEEIFTGVDISPVKSQGGLI